LFFYLLFYFSSAFNDIFKNDFIEIIFIILILLIISINCIIISKNYIIKNFTETYDTEFNNYKTIILQSIKIYFKYIIILILLLITLSIIIFVIDIILEEYFHSIFKIEQIFESSLAAPFLGFIFLLLFFKLIFIVNVLVFKQENYKIKFIVKKSYQIIKHDKLYFLITYFGINILLILGLKAFENNYVHNVFCSIVHVVLFILYQIKYLETIEKNIIFSKNIE